MVKETLANHIRTLGKRDFDIAYQFVLNEIFSLVSVNVDGRNDNGTDFTTFNADDSRTLCAWQITTQKTDIKNKAYRDAKKAIDKLKAKRYFFINTYSLSESEARNLVQEYTTVESDKLRMTSDKTFSSPSTAADFCIGSSNNGWLVWKDNDGNTLDSVYRKQLE